MGATRIGKGIRSVRDDTPVLGWVQADGRERGEKGRGAMAGQDRDSVVLAPAVS